MIKPQHSYWPGMEVFPGMHCPPFITLVWCSFRNPESCLSDLLHLLYPTATEFPGSYWLLVSIFGEHLALKLAAATEFILQSLVLVFGVCNFPVQAGFEFSSGFHVPPVAVMLHVNVIL